MVNKCYLGSRSRPLLTLVKNSIWPCPILVQGDIGPDSPRNQHHRHGPAWKSAISDQLRVADIDRTISVSSRSAIRWMCCLVTLGWTTIAICRPFAKYDYRAPIKAPAHHHQIEACYFVDDHAKMRPRLPPRRNDARNVPRVSRSRRDIPCPCSIHPKNRPVSL